MVGSLLQKCLFLKKNAFKGRLNIINGQYCQTPFYLWIPPEFISGPYTFQLQTARSFVEQYFFQLLAFFWAWTCSYSWRCLWEPVPVNKFACVPHRTWLEDSDRFRFPPLSFCKPWHRDCSGHGGLGAQNFFRVRDASLWAVWSWIHWDILMYFLWQWNDGRTAWPSKVYETLDTIGEELPSTVHPRYCICVV